MADQELSHKANSLKKAADFFKRSAREASWQIANTALGFLAAGALFPFLVEQPEKALAGLLGGASVEILSSWLRKAADKREADTGALASVYPLVPHPLRVVAYPRPRLGRRRHPQT